MTGTMTKIGKSFMAAMLAAFICVTPSAAAFAEEGADTDAASSNELAPGDVAFLGDEVAPDGEAPASDGIVPDSENAAPNAAGYQMVATPNAGTEDSYAARDAATADSDSSDTVKVLWENQDGTVLYEMDDVSKDAIPAADEYNKLSGKANPAEPDVGDMRHEFTGWFRIDDPEGKVLYIANYKLQPKDAATYVLTVKYVLPDGTEAAPSHTEALGQGARYDVPSPELPGYTPDQEVVRGVMGDQDQTVTVTYANQESTSLVDTDAPNSDNAKAVDPTDSSNLGQTDANADNDNVSNAEKTTDNDSKKATDSKAEKPSKDRAEKTTASNAKNTTASTADKAADTASTAKANKETLPQTGDQNAALGVGVGAVALTALVAAGYAATRRREN